MQQNQDTRKTAEVYHATAYGSLYDKLLRYRHANALERQGILCLAIQQLQNLQEDVQSDAQLALQQFETMVQIASLIHYAKNMRNLETHQYIDIVEDFKNMSLEPDAQLGVSVDLREWFVMNPDGCKIKFKKDIEHYSAASSREVWRSFEAARARHISKHGKKEFRDNYVRITDFTMRDDGLFPGTYTWLEKYHNEVVGRIVYDRHGNILNMVQVGDECYLSSEGLRNTPEEAMIRVPQLLEIWAGSGSQITTLMLSKAKEKDPENSSARTLMNLIKYLSICTKFRSSYLLLILEAYKYGIKKGDIHLKESWNATDFNYSRQAMIDEIKQYLLAPQYLCAHGAAIMNKLLVKANVPSQISLEINQRFQSVITNINTHNMDPKDEIAQFDQYIIDVIKSKKMVDAIKAILWVICAGVLVGCGGFGVGLAVGAWLSPNAFFAVLAGNPLVLTLCSSMLITVMAGVAYKQFGLFSHNNKLYSDIKTVEHALETEITNYYTYYK